MGLLPFLRASERYPLEEALAVCQRKGLREEVAYLLGRAGRDHLDALESKRLRAFGSESQQPQPPPIATPAHVLRLLPGETPLPRIAVSVQRVLDSLRLSADLHEACSKISSAEMVSQKEACIHRSNRGTELSCQRCALCGAPFGGAGGIVIVGRTVWHQRCHRAS
eukprot:g10861.t1